MSSSSSPTPLSNVASSSEGPVIPYRVWDEGGEHAMAKCILPLTPDMHKGSSGRIGVLGGSARYTGAPFYAAMASLKVGADLAYVFCADEACIPIKSYSPELMVAPVYKASEFDSFVKASESESDEAEKCIANMVEEVESMMEKLHALIIGPGLGRCPMVLEATARIIRQARSIGLPIVLDADGLFLLTLEKYEDVLKGYDKIVMTPNVIEIKRLEGKESNWVDATIVRKGKQDVIMRGDRKLVECHENGGLKRPGGLGDCLSGTLGTLVAWNRIMTEQDKASADDLPMSCWTASCFVRKATEQAFNIHRRSMTAPDVLNELGSVVNQMTSS